MSLWMAIPVAFAAFGLAGFILASWFGMTPWVAVLSAVIVSPGLRFIEWPKFNRRAVVVYAVVGLALGAICSRAVIENESGIYTGLDTNFGDLPFHIGVISSFVYGNNFPPEHPEFAGVPMTYPFIADFVTAMYVTLGASLESAFFWQNFLTMLALVGLLYNWSLKLTENRVAAVLTPALVFFSGGFGWITLVKEAAHGEGIIRMLGHLPHDYTVNAIGYRWANAVTALFIPQRGILLGAALAVVVWTLWLDARDKRKMIMAGVVAGLMPLVHAHSFVVTMTMGASIAVLDMAFRNPNSEIRNPNSRFPTAPGWFLFIVVATVIALPQILWATSGSAVQGGNFLAWEPGWDHGQTNPVWFWFTNTALFIPLLLVSLAWLIKRRETRILYYYLPFLLCFIIPNLFRLSPWIWDNVKILFFWWIASAPIVGLLLARLWQFRGALAVTLLVVQLSAGALDVWRVAYRTVEHRIYDNDGIRFAEIIRRETAPGALILHAPIYNDPVYLTGRRTFMGYDGHLWSHGLDYSSRLDELKRIYSGAPDAEYLLAANRIEYVVIGPLERAQIPINDVFFSRFAVVGQSGGYRLYKPGS